MAWFYDRVRSRKVDGKSLRDTLPKAKQVKKTWTHKGDGLDTLARKCMRSINPHGKDMCQAPFYLFKAWKGKDTNIGKGDGLSCVLVDK